MSVSSAGSREEASQAVWVPSLLTGTSCDSLLLPYAVGYREVTSKSTQFMGLTVAGVFNKTVE